MICVLVSRLHSECRVLNDCYFIFALHPFIFFLSSVSHLQRFVTLFFQVAIVLVLREGVMMVVVDPLLFHGESLKLNLGALSLLHRLELVSCRHGPTQRRGLGHVTKRTTKELLSKHFTLS